MGLYRPFSPLMQKVGGVETLLTKLTCPIFSQCKALLLWPDDLEWTI